MVLIDKVKSLLSEIPAIFIAIKRKDTSLLAKLFGGITIVYALSPVDLIPDFIPILGYLDDVIILPILVIVTKIFISTDIMVESRKSAKKIWKKGKPKKWYYAIPIVLIWVAVILLVYFNFIK